MSRTARRPSRALVTTATIGTVVMLLTATIALAAATSRPGHRLAGPRSEAADGNSGYLSLTPLQSLTPPPGAALLLIAGLIAARRGHR